MVQRTPEGTLSFNRNEIIALATGLGSVSFGIGEDGVDHRPAEYALRRPIDTYVRELWAPNGDPSKLPDTLEFDDGVAFVAGAVLKRFVNGAPHIPASDEERAAAQTSFDELQALTKDTPPAASQPSLEAIRF